MIVALIVALVVCSRLRGDEPDIAEYRSYAVSLDNSGLISAPVVYKDIMLIAVTSEGVAAIMFTDGIDHGAKYRFRYLPNDDGEEQTGVGGVFEQYKDGQYDGGKLTIRAGKIKIGWSAGGDDRGWVYYLPETTTIQIASSERFQTTTKPGPDGELVYEKLDLKRFRTSARHVSPSSIKESEQKHAPECDSSGFSHGQSSRRIR